MAHKAGKRAVSLLSLYLNESHLSSIHRRLSFEKKKNGPNADHMPSRVCSRSAPTAAAAAAPPVCRDAFFPARKRARLGTWEKWEKACVCVFGSDCVQIFVERIFQTRLTRAVN